MVRLLIFHLSDLHFGSGFEGTPHPVVGLGGHENGVCDALPFALRHARLSDFNTDANDKLVYFIGGDLTRTGSDHDFHLVYTYLYSHLDWLTDRHANPDSVRLGLPVGDTYSVPGNHDHWNGSLRLVFQPAYNSGVFPDFLETTPWRHSIAAPDGSFILELFGVDSNEGLRNWSTNLRAEGALSDEELHGVYAGGAIVKKGLQQLLEDAEADEKNDKVPRLRAVGCHHSFGNRGGLFDAQPLHPNSMGDLLKLCRQFKVHAVLTGHTHYFLNWQHNPINTGWYVWELRCGSTLQRRRATASTPCTQPQPQGFLVYELTLKTNKPSWTVWKYQYGTNHTGHWAFYRNPHGKVIC